MWLDCLAMTTVQSLRSRLQARRGEWPAIATSAGLSYWWVMKVGQGKIEEPGLTKVERLVAELDRRDDQRGRAA